MNDKIVAVCESAFGFNALITSENQKAMEDIERLTESEKALIGFTDEKVKVDSDGVDHFITYSNNLEQYIKDSGLGLDEAVDNICKRWDILKESVVIVVDESCVDKIDMVTLTDQYNVKRI